MSRRLKERQIHTRTARLRLKPRREPYWRRVSTRTHLGYRRNASGCGTWVARRYDGSRYRESTLGQADDERRANGGDVLDFGQAHDRALQWFEEMGRREAGLPPRKAGGYTVRHCVNDYLDWFAANRKSLRATRNVVESYILPAFGGRQVESLNTPELRKWLQEIAATPKRGAKVGPVSEAERNEQVRRRRVTANRIWAVFRAALNMAFREGQVSSDLAWRRVQPFRGVDRPRVRFLETEQVLRLLDACDPDFERLVLGALFTGCRYGELTRLCVEDFRNDAVHIQEAKSGKARVIFVNDEALRFFTRMTQGRPGGERLFLREDGIPWATSQQIRRMEEASRQAGISPHATFHILRHTYASHYLMNGGELAGLSKQLGHADTRMTIRHYAHLAEGWRRDAARQFAPSFKRPPRGSDGNLTVGPWGRQ